MSPRRPTPAAATHTGFSLNDRLALLPQVVCPSPGSRLTTRLRFPNGFQSRASSTNCKDRIGESRRLQRVSQWARLGSNQRPPACEAGALPLSYAPRLV
jgi:hypothetical protein